MRSFCITLLMAGCASDEGPEPEGALAGECLDGRDNDIDGFIDCDDNDCGAGPDCAGGDTGEVDTGPSYEVSWSDGILHLAIVGGSGRYAFGMVDANGTGWTGEDCFVGYDSWQICHDAVPASGLSLTVVSSYADVVKNETTLYSHHDAAQQTTYYLGSESGSCVTWGERPDYYVDAFGCTPQ